jgi:hypothetical protein
MWDRRLQKDNAREYTVDDFNYILGTTHRNPGDGLEYIVKAVRKHRGLIVVDRKLRGPMSKKYDTIQAGDITKYHREQTIRPIFPMGQSNRRRSWSNWTAAMDTTTARVVKKTLGGGD